MARKTTEELNDIAIKQKVKSLWSWSRYNCFKTDTYEYYLKYILKKREDRKDGIYATSGGAAHDILERFYKGEIEYSDMIEEYEDKLLLMNVDELKYDRSDSEKNEKIANKYEACLKHFFQNHIPIQKPYLQEEFVLVRISDDIVLQGYIDFLNIEQKEESNQKHIYIRDWKTSTIYKGKKIDSEKGQLLLYCEAIRKKTGLPLEQIHGGWEFLKYVSVECEQVGKDKEGNTKYKTRYIDRHEIGLALANNIKMWLKKSEVVYTDEQIEDFVRDAIVLNSLDGLPEDVKNKFSIKDCFVEIPISEESIEELKGDIVTTIADIKNREEQYKENKDENIFWQEVTQADSYCLANLSGYSRNLHKPYDEYLNNLEMFENTETKDEEFENWLSEL